MFLKSLKKFTQWWLWVILFSVYALVVSLPLLQIVTGNPIGSKLAPTIVLLIPVLIFSIILWLMYSLRLNTKVDANGIEMVYWPFTKRNLSWQTIKTIDVIDYGFVGGWGIRLWTKYGTVYNVKGKLGLAIELYSGKKLVIGTQNSKGLIKVLEALKKA